MVLRVQPTPTRFPTNNLYTPIDNASLHSIDQASATCGATDDVAASPIQVNTRPMLRQCEIHYRIVVHQADFKYYMSYWRLFSGSCIL